MSAFEDYIAHLRRTNYRPGTIVTLRNALVRVRRATGLPLLDVTPQAADDWWALHTSGPAGRRTDLSALHGFYRWAGRNGLIDADPTARLAMPRKPHRMPRPMADTELRRALDGADDQMAAVLLVAAFCGLRIGEIARIRWRDVLDVQDPPALFVAEGKGGRQRIVPLPAIVADALHGLPHRGPYVFLRGDGRPGGNSPARLSQKANRYLRSVGVPATVHQLRHRYATEVYRSCRDLRLTQELCGHASPETTAQYTKYAAEDGAGVVARVAELWASVQGVAG